MKMCVTCHEVKALDAFNRRRSARDGRQPRCRDCCKAWYVANKREHVAAAGRRTRRVRDIYRRRIADYLATHPCVDCGVDELVLLEFDHRPGTAKVADISAMVLRLFAWEAILEEIEKCDVRCANCHRRRTSERAGQWRHLYTQGLPVFDVEARLVTLFPI